MKVRDMGRFRAERFITLMLGRYGSFDESSDIMVELNEPLQVENRDMVAVYYSGQELDTYVLVDNHDNNNIQPFPIAQLTYAMLQALVDYFVAYHNERNDTCKFE